VRVAGGKHDLDEHLFAAAVGWLLSRRAASIPVSDTSAKLRARLDQLLGAGIVERSRGAYRASHLALYSKLSTPSATDPRTDKRVIRSTATT
jgi:hypothetical protein